LVRRLKEDLLERLRPQLDGWPIGDDAIVICSLGKDTAGNWISDNLTAYFKAAALCVHIEESPQWNELLERSLVAALYRCAGPEVVRGNSAKGGRKSAKAKIHSAAEWRTKIMPQVNRFIVAGKTDSNIGVLLADSAGKSAETVRRFVAKVRAKKKLGT
jgi:hypothetical protein